MPRIESSKRRYTRKTTQRFKAWLIQKNRKKRLQEITQYSPHIWIDSTAWNDADPWED